jgi:xylulokinase
VLEGVSFGLRDSFELMKESGLKNISQVRVTGGGARSPIWRQILADILNAEVVTVHTTEGAAYGAALLAGTGSGAFRSVEEACDATIQITGSVKPSDNQKSYENSYALYRDLYPSLKPTFDGVA